MSRLISRYLVVAAGLALAGSALAATVVMKDDFSNAGSGWPNFAATRDSDLGFAVYTDTGGYQLTPVKDGVFGFIEAPKQASGGNVRVTADLFLYAGIGAGGAGIACRFQDAKNFYAFVARGDAMVAIVRVKDGKPELLKEARGTSVMPGAVDTELTVSCNGDTLEFAAKGATRLVARDATFAGGKVGLLVIGEKMAGTSASFDDFTLTDAAR